METVALDRISRTDTRFCVSYPLEDPVLFASITAFGIRMPLLLLDTTPYTVVAGFKRLDAAHRLGLSVVPCCISRMNEKDAVLTAITDNIKRPLNMVERALGLDKLAQSGFSRDAMYGMMKLFGYEPHEKILQNFLALAHADHETKRFIVEHAANMTIVELLFAFENGDRNGIVRLLTAMHPTFSQLREILQYLLLVKVKEGELPWDKLRAVFTADQLKLSLKKRTHPILSTLEDRLKEIRTKAGLPPQITLTVDPFFERESIDITIRARRSEDVEEAILTLDRLVKDGWVRGILELTDGTYRN
jgi:hypothetical protein